MNEDFFKELEVLLNKYNAEIETLCDSIIGIPLAVVHTKGSKDYFNIDQEEGNSYRFGEAVTYYGG